MSERCSHTDYPVWVDGSQDAIRCELDDGHEGRHQGLLGSVQWRWGKKR